MYSELSFDEVYERSINGPDYGIGALYSGSYARANGGATEFGEDDGTADFAEERLVFMVTDERPLADTADVVGSMLIRRNVMKVNGRERLILDADLPQETEQAAA